MKVDYISIKQCALFVDQNLLYPMIFGNDRFDPLRHTYDQLTKKYELVRYLTTAFQFLELSKLPKSDYPYPRFKPYDPKLKGADEGTQISHITTQLNEAREHFDALPSLSQDALQKLVAELRRKLPVNDTLKIWLFDNFLQRYVDQPEVTRLLSDYLANDFIQGEAINNSFVTTDILRCQIYSCVKTEKQGVHISFLKAAYAYAQRAKLHALATDVGIKPASDKVDCDLSILTQFGLVPTDGKPPYLPVVALTGDPNINQLRARKALLLGVIEAIAKDRPHEKSFLPNPLPGITYSIDPQSGKIRDTL